MKALRILTALLVGATLGGCTRSPPSELRLETPGAREFSQWRTRNHERFTAAEWTEFDAMVQELRWKAVLERRENSKAEVVVAELVNGRTFREVLRHGYEAKRLRLETVRAEMKEAVDANALLLTKSDDRDSTRRLETFRTAQLQRLMDLDAELRAADVRVAELGGAPAPERRLEVRPATLTREAARREIDALIAKRRGLATFNYGTWPVRLDSDGTQLTGEERADFERRRAASTHNGHGVVAIRLKDKWWIFDGPVPLLDLPGAVTANLTDDDRFEIASRWARLHVEIWARAEAHKASGDAQPKRVNE